MQWVFDVDVPVQTDGTEVEYLWKAEEKNDLYEGHSEAIDTLLLQWKRKIYSRNWDPIISRCSLWELNPSLDRFNQDREKGRSSTFERNLNVALTPWSTSLQVNNAIPCVLSLSFENRGEQRVDRWLGLKKEKK